MKFDCLNVDDVTAFDWDDGNIDKNEKKHGIKSNLIEEVFFNEPLVIAKDVKHSEYECRCVAFGITDERKKLTVIFIKRKNKIRVISARYMSKKERVFYENY